MGSWVLIIAAWYNLGQSSLAEQGLEGVLDRIALGRLQRLAGENETRLLPLRENDRAFDLLVRSICSGD